MMVAFTAKDCCLVYYKSKRETRKKDLYLLP